MFLLVLGTKLILIATYGNLTPYWDQWDAEAAHLYKPYVEGALGWGKMFQPHNEHRIFFSRLLGLMLFEAAGEWDPMLQMVVNAVLHCGFIVLLVWFIWPMVKSGERLAMIVVVAVIFGLPLGWENTLAGFQSPFYFLLIFSSFALYFFVDARPFDQRYWLALVLCVCAYFSLASGALTVMAAIVILVIQIFAGVRERDPRQIGGITLLIITAGLMLAFTTQVPSHDPLKAHSLGQFLQALWITASAPLSGIGLALHLPLLWLAIEGLRDPKRTTRTFWLVLALAGWVAMQMVSLAYGRAVGANAPRYYDISLVLLPLDFAALLWLTNAESARSMNRYLPTLWVAALVMGLAIVTPRGAFKQVNEKGQLSLLQEKHTRAFLATGDIDTIAQKPFLHIPYPNAKRLAALLSDSTIRTLLPLGLRPRDVDVGAIHSRLLTGGKIAPLVRGLNRGLLRHAPVILALGGVLLFAAFFRRHPDDTAERLL
jgi:hypothetical protein